MSLSSASRLKIRPGMIFNLPLLVVLVISFGACGGKQSNQTQATASPAVSPDSSKGQAEPARKIFESGEAVPAGYLGYKIVNSWFKDQSHSSLLYIDMAIVNTDKKERPVAMMKLIDETGKEFSLSEKGDAKGPSITQVGLVGPGQSKRATAVFEVPRGHEYKLKIEGFSASDEVQIKLKPAAKPPAG